MYLFFKLLAVLGHCCMWAFSSCREGAPLRCGLSLQWLLLLVASLVAQMVKCLPAMQETRVQSLGWEDPLEKEMATHSSILAWKSPRTEEPGRLQSMG